MAATNGAGGFPPQKTPGLWEGPRRPRSPQHLPGSPEQNGTSTVIGKIIVSGQQKTESTHSPNGQTERASKKSEEVTDFMDDLTLSSPEGRRSRSRSRSSCSSLRSSSRSSSRSSYSSRSSSSTSSSSGSWSRSRSRSRSHPKRNCSRRNRRYSRSYSRSRSRSRSYRYKERYPPRYYSRRYHRSPPRYRSRSRSPRRLCYRRRPYSRSRSRSRRYYGFGRTIYPEAYRSWRSRSRSRSHSRTPLRLTEKEKRELLEIAKANAAKALGTDIVLPASLQIATKPKEMEIGKPKDGTETEKAMARPVALKPTNLLFKEAAGSPGREEKKESPSGQWIPVKNEENLRFHNFSPKNTSFRAR